MAVGGKVMQMLNRATRLGVLTTLLAFLLSSAVSAAVPPAPVLGESEWRTGELEVCYTGAIPGHTIILYSRTYDAPNYAAKDAWTATAAAECHVVDPYENGQTIWYYIVQIDPATADESEPSNIGRQTPPITAYIINWPDMLSDIGGMINDANQAMQDKLDSLFTPSPAAMNNLTDAVNGLKDALGIGAVTGSAGQIQDGLGQVGAGLRPPVVVDDGDGTFTGGSNPGQSPFQPMQPGGGGGMQLEVDNPDSGTMNEISLRLPYGVGLDGELLYVRLFTDEQLEKMKWWGLIRDVVAATIFILFAFWLTARFAPQFKV